MAKGPPKTRIMSEKASASDPVQIQLSMRKLRALAPELFNFFGLPMRAKFAGGDSGVKWTSYFREHLYKGDSRAAVVLQITPALLVACYSDEFDYSVVLEFPSALADEYGLTPGTRLLTVNTYTFKTPKLQLFSDLINGPESLDNYANFRPVIAEFLSEDYDEIEARKKSIDEREWQRAAHWGREFLKSKKPRLGGPFYAAIPRANLTSRTFPPPARKFWML